MSKYSTHAKARPLAELLGLVLLAFAAATPASAAWDCGDKAKHGIDLAQSLNLR